MESSHEGTTDVLPWCQGDMQRVHPVAGEFLKRKVYLDDTMNVFKTEEPPAGEEPWKTSEWLLRDTRTSGLTDFAMYQAW